MIDFKMILDPYNDQNSFFKNGKTLPSIGLWSKYLKKDFLDWAHEALKCVSKEANDKFALTVVSEKLEALLCASIFGESSDCIKCDLQQFPIGFPVRERLKAIQSLAQKYHVSIDEARYRFPTSVAGLTMPAYACYAADEQALLFLDFLENDLRKEKFLNFENSQIMICRSHKTCVDFNRGKVIWKVEDKLFQIVLGALEERYYVILVKEWLKAVSQAVTVSGLSNEEKHQLKMVTCIDGVFDVDDIPKVEVGKTFVPKIYVSNAAESMDWRMESSDSNILQVQGKSLRGVSKGIVEVKFYKAHQSVPCVVKTVEVFATNYITQLDFTLPPSLGIGEDGRLALSFSPLDATDSQTIAFGTSNNTVLTVDNTGYYRAIAPGKVTLWAKSNNLMQSKEVEVLPDIVRFDLSEDVHYLGIGEQKRMQVTSYPTNCYDATFSVTSTNSDIVEVSSAQGFVDLKAKSAGSCEIVCKATRGGCVRILPINVETSFAIKERFSLHPCLYFSSVFLILSFLGLLLQAFWFELFTTISSVLLSWLGVYFKKELLKDFLQRDKLLAEQVLSKNIIWSSVVAVLSVLLLGINAVITYF